MTPRETMSAAVEALDVAGDAAELSRPHSSNGDGSGAQRKPESESLNVKVLLKKRRRALKRHVLRPRERTQRALMTSLRRSSVDT